MNVTGGDWKPRGLGISENALQMHIPNLQYSGDDYQLAQRLAAAFRSNGSSAWIADTCAAWGLHVEVQHTPACVESTQTHASVNVICRVAGRGVTANREGFAIATLVQQLDSNARMSAPAQHHVAAVMSLAQRLHVGARRHWLAKDVLFVFALSPDADCSTRAFVHAYHDTQLHDSNTQGESPLRSHSGPLLGAIVMDAAAEEFTTVSVLTHSHMMPELDFMAVVVKHMAPSFSVSMLPLESQSRGDAVRLWMNHPYVHAAVYAWTAATGITISQPAMFTYADRAAAFATHVVSTLLHDARAHTSFLRYGVPAVSLQLHAGGSAGGHVHQPWQRFCEALERIVRSINGLDERLHASIRAYIPIDENAFVGVGEFAPAGAVMNVPVLLLTATASVHRAPVVAHACIAAILVVIIMNTCTSLLSASLAAVAGVVVANRILSAVTHRIAAGGDSAPFIAWMAIGLPQFGLLYAHYGLFLYVCVTAVPILLLLEALRRCSKQAGTPTLRATLSIVYVGVGWCIFALVGELWDRQVGVTFSEPARSYAMYITIVCSMLTTNDLDLLLQAAMRGRDV